MKKYIFTAICATFSLQLFAQFEIHRYDNRGRATGYAGVTIPGYYMALEDQDGLFANPGVLAGFDVQFIIAYGLGFGLTVEQNNFSFDHKNFLLVAGADSIIKYKGYRSSKFGLMAVANAPITFGKSDFSLNIFIKGQAGFRTFYGPEFDMFFHPLENRYVQVNYRPRENTMGYLGYSAGIEFLITPNFGITCSYQSVIPSKHKLEYSIRAFDEEAKIHQLEQNIISYFDFRSIQIGIVLTDVNEKKKK